MAFVLSDNREIVAGIEAAKALVLARGGYVHPAASIEECDGSLRVVCNAFAGNGHILFRIPEALLIPVESIGWTEDADTLKLAKRSAGLSADQSEMLDLSISIYNASGKLRWMQQHPYLILRQDPDLSRQVSLVKPPFAATFMSSSAAFIQTRSFSRDGILSGKTCMLPLIDFLNHHADGARHELVSGCLETPLFQLVGSGECFASYGKCRDPLDLALGYGYLDPLSPYAASVPAAVDIPAFGTLEVAACYAGSNHWSKPPKVDFTPGGLTLSHFVLDTRNPGQALALLRLAMAASGKKRGLDDAVVERAIVEVPAALFDANREKLAAFRSYLSFHPKLKLAELLIQACDCQMSNLQKALSG